VKLLSTSRVDSADFGIYSHRLPGGEWLVGGASNTGGAVLRSVWGGADSDAQLASLSSRIDPSVASPLHLYPLVTAGERFPVCDPGLQPVMGPRPDDDALYLHALLEGMARIEADGYHQLARLGATSLRRVLTAGGGARNAQWTAIRERVLGVPVDASAQGEAAYGAALLARRALASP
jgi:sugar (pentulose or hexulose) kinase